MTTIASPKNRLGTGRGKLADRLFRGGSGLAAALIIVLLVGIGLMLTLTSIPAFREFGVVGFITGTSWNPVKAVYGALPYIVGTLLSSGIALLISTPIAILTAIYLAELAPRRVAIPLTFMVELIAAIPSVVIGLWGVFVLSPLLRGTVETWISSTIGQRISLFEGPPLGIGLFAAGVILAIMILPTIVSVSREVITSVPMSQREAMFALGATRWEVVTKAVVPAARSGRDDGGDDGHRERPGPAHVAVRPVADHRLEDRDDLQRGDRRAPDLEPHRPWPDPARDHDRAQHHRPGARLADRRPGRRRVIR